MVAAGIWREGGHREKEVGRNSLLSITRERNTNSSGGRTTDGRTDGREGSSEQQSKYSEWSPSRSFVRSFSPEGFAFQIFKVSIAWRRSSSRAS